MKKVLTILFCLFTLAALSQSQPRKKYKGVIPNEASGYGYKTMVADSALGLPRYPAKLDTGQVKYLGRQGDALMFADTLAGRIYWYNPHQDTVLSVGSGDGTNVTNFYSNGSTARQFSDTIKYFSNGSLTDIKFYMGAKYVSNIRTMTENGSGFLPTSGMNGDSVHLYYPISPYDTVWYIFSGSYADTNVLAPPTGLIATPLDATKMLLTFNNVQHNNGYEIWYGFTGGEYQYAATLDEDDTSYEHSGLPPDTKVFWEVRTLGDTAWYGSNFSYTSARTEALVPITTPSITATANSSTQITVNWSVSPHASAFVLMFTTDRDDFSLIDTLPAGTTSYIHDSLSTGTRITYKLQAIGDDSVYSSSAFSDTVSATTFALPSVPKPNLTIDSTHTTDVYMHWTASTGATGYLVQYSTDKVNWLLATQTSADTTFFVHRNLSPGTKIFYQVQGLGNTTTTDNSAFDLDSATTQSEVIPLLRTPQLVVTPSTPNRNVLTWNDLRNEISYIVQRSPDGAAWTTIATPAQNVTTYTDNGLIANTTYHYRLQGVGDGVHFLNSLWDSATITTNPLITLVAPALTLTAPRYDSVYASWTNISNESNFILDYSLDKITWINVDRLAANTLSDGLSKLIASKKYYLRVKGGGNQTTYGDSPYDIDSVTTPAQPSPSADTLLAPNPLNATAISTTQVTITWSNQANEVGYQVERSTNKSVWAIITTTAANVTTYTDAGRTAGTKYYYRALTKANGTTFVNSLYSNIDSATTNALTVLATPTTDAVQNTSTSNIVNWTNVANESNFTVRYSLDKTNWTNIFTAAANVLTYTHPNLIPSTKYFYQTQANGDGITYANSAWSNIDSATTLAAAVTPLDAPEPTATPISFSRIDVSWGAITNATGYKIDRSLNGTAWTNLATLASTVTSYSNTGLNPATTYQYRVQATTTNPAYTNSNYGLTSATTFDTSTTTTAIVHGVMLGGSTQAKIIGTQNEGVNTIRSSYDGVGANYTNFNNLLKVLFNYEPQTPGDGLPLPTDSAQFACTLDSMLTENGTKNMIGIVIINEENNVGYWTDNVSAGNYLRLLQACVNVGHRRGIPVYDGGVTGPISRYEVWWDYMQRGFTDSAADYQARAFPNGTNLNNWRTSSNYASRIKFMDTLIANLKNVPTDAVNVHWYETVRDEDAAATSVSEQAFIQTCKFYSRITGKPVITNEYGLNNNSNINILNGLMNALKPAGIKIAVFYGVNNLTNSDGSLTPLGVAYRNAIGGAQ